LNKIAIYYINCLYEEREASSVEDKQSIGLSLAGNSLELNHLGDGRFSLCIAGQQGLGRQEVVSLLEKILSLGQRGRDDILVIFDAFMVSTQENQDVKSFDRRWKISGSDDDLVVRYNYDSKDEELFTLILGPEMTTGDRDTSLKWLEDKVKPIDCGRWFSIVYYINVCWDYRLR